MGEPVGTAGEWPPREAAYQGALFFGAAHLRKREFLKAVRHFRRAADAAPRADDRELARALVHLAAAGQKRRAGDGPGCERQLVHARRRLAPFLPASRRLDLGALVTIVEE